MAGNAASHPLPPTGATMGGWVDTLSVNIRAGSAHQALLNEYQLT